MISLPRLDLVAVGFVDNLMSSIDHGWKQTEVMIIHRLGVEPARLERVLHFSSHSTVLRALGGLGAELMMEPDWKDRLTALKGIDWSKTNPDWQNVCIIANSVVSNRQARAATKVYIKSRLGMLLTEAEQRSFEKAA